MKFWYNYLNDRDFLTQIVTSYSEEYFIKIYSLTWDEEIIQNIEGKAISVNVNLDGQSSMRRTANLTFIADDLVANITKVDNIFSINKKIFLEIGYKNNTAEYMEYPIIWMPLGLYVIVSASISHSTSGWTISVQLKDKMALLNGQCGGVFPASVVFDNYDTIDQNGVPIVARPTIYQIIQQMVNHWGKQQLGKIIISDLDTKVKQVMKWVGGIPLYYFKRINEESSEYFLTTNEEDYQTYSNNIKDEKGNNIWKELKYSPYQYGEDIGYIYTDFSYPGDLIANVGDTITSILDKIIGVLGNYEYFYDIYGNFVFQQKKNYLNVAEPFYNETDDNIFNIDVKYTLNKNINKTVFSFSDNQLINSYNNTPQYNKIKNDFIIWGLMKKSDQIEIPIRYHLAIDKKPKIGNTYSAIKYTDPEDGLQKWKGFIEINWKTEDGITNPAFPEIGDVNSFYYLKSNNKSNKNYSLGIYQWKEMDDGHYQYQKNSKLKIQNVTTKNWRNELYFQGVIAEPYGFESNDYYTELKNEWPKIYDIKSDRTILAVISGKNSAYYSQIIDSNKDYLETQANTIRRNNSNIVGTESTQIIKITTQSNTYQVNLKILQTLFDKKNYLVFQSSSGFYKEIKNINNNYESTIDGLQFYAMTEEIYKTRKLIGTVKVNSQTKEVNYYEIQIRDTKNKAESILVIYNSNDQCYEQIGTITNGKCKTINKRLYLSEKVTIKPITLYKLTINQSDFNQQYVKDPSKLTYFLDFIDSSNSAAISEFDVSNIGRRTYAVDRSSDINCLFEPEIEDVIFIKTNSNLIEANESYFSLINYCNYRGQKYYQISENIYNALTIGGESRSAYEQIRQLLHQYTDFNETISLQTLPLYFLQPNTRISVFDEKSNIYGDYLINSLSFSIANNSTMTINATRALEKI